MATPLVAIMEDENPMRGLGKQRMKWTPELHRCFEQAVNQLGGPDRATPKGLFRVMSMPGLTVTHVKSHLQKYRMSNFVLESSDRNKLENKPASEILPNFCAASQFQITEALQRHMEIRRKSHDQLEAGRILKIRIELQGRYLEKFLEEEHDFNSNCRTDLSCPTALPTLSDLSESNSWNYSSHSEIISGRFNNNPYLQDKSLSRHIKWQIKPQHSGSQTGIPFDESHGQIGLYRTSSVSQASKRLRV